MLEPVRKTRDAMFFVKNSSDIWVPCGPEQPGAVQITMLELAAQGHASKVSVDSLDMNNSYLFHRSLLVFCSSLPRALYLSGNSMDHLSNPKSLWNQFANELTSNLI